jgi:hypothetical protein
VWLAIDEKRQLGERVSPVLSFPDSGPCGVNQAMWRGEASESWSYRCGGDDTPIYWTFV